MREVVIVGGGVVGLWCAWHLQRAGVAVTIVDKDDLTDGCSYGNAGMIVPSHFIPMASPGIIAQGIRWMFKKDSPFYIRPRLNTPLAQWLWMFYRSANSKHVNESMALLRDMHTESREEYRQLQQTPGFDFRFEQKGILMLYRTPGAEEDEMRTAETAHHLGIEAHQMTLDQLSSLEPGLKMSVRGAVHYPGDAHLHPDHLMHQLKTHLLANGAEILANQEVIRMEDLDNKGCRVSFRNHKVIETRQAIIATGSWTSSLMKTTGYQLPVQDGKGYSMTLTNPSWRPSIPAILHEARVAITPMGDDLRISGTLEISGMDGKINPSKVNSILNAIPDYYSGSVINNPGPVWFGYRPCTPDGLPFIGRLRKGSSIVVATGHAMMGLSLAPVTGRMVRDIVLRDVHPHDKLLPLRF